MNVTTAAQLIGQVHVPAAKVAAMLSKAQRAAIESGLYVCNAPYRLMTTWVEGRKSTLDSLMRLGLVEARECAGSTAHWLTVEGEKVWHELLPASRERAHVEADEIEIGRLDDARRDWHSLGPWLVATSRTEAYERARGVATDRRSPLDPRWFEVALAILRDEAHAEAIAEGRVRVALMGEASGSSRAWGAETMSDLRAYAARSGHAAAAVALRALVDAAHDEALHVQAVRVAIDSLMEAAEGTAEVMGDEINPDGSGGDWSVMCHVCGSTFGRPHGITSELSAWQFAAKHEGLDCTYPRKR